MTADWFGLVVQGFIIALIVLEWACQRSRKAAGKLQAASIDVLTARMVTLSERVLVLELASATLRVRRVSVEPLLRCPVCKDSPKPGWMQMPGHDGELCEQCNGAGFDTGFDPGAKAAL